MPKRAWAYVIGVLLVGAAFCLRALLAPAPPSWQWPMFIALLVFATASQFFKVLGQTHEAYHINLIFLFVGFLLLHPLQYVLLVCVPHLLEWAKERLLRTSALAKWHIQPFNIAVHIICGATAALAYAGLVGDATTVPQVVPVMAGCLAAGLYVVLNHLLVGQYIVLARGVTWRDSGVMAWENVFTDLVLLLLGFIIASIWPQNPWLTLPALSTLLLMYRALKIPQLKRQAQTDEKTGLWNARHFVNLLTTELERSYRFERPLALIMSDLDLLRNVNNTYGHLAGDEVLKGVAQTILANIRAYDIAGRFGGEEFCIVLPETGREEAQEMAERLREAVASASFTCNTVPVPLRATMSFGIASFPADATNANDLIHRADLAVYQAKLRGRNRVVDSTAVPRFNAHATGAPSDRIPTVAVTPFVPQSEPLDSTPTPAGVKPRPVLPPARPGAGQPRPHRLAIPTYVAAVVCLGLAVGCLGLLLGAPLDVRAIAVFLLLAALAQAPQVKNLYGDTSVSVSVAINFAAALAVGMPGVIVVSFAIALAHWLQRRPLPYKALFNWATHLLAGAAPVFLIQLSGIPVSLDNLVFLILPVVGAALAYYLIDTGLVSAAIGLAEGADFIHTWQERFRWLSGQYLVLCMLGLVLATAYTALGVVGVFVFSVPVMMMGLTQKQYLERTARSVRELKRMNEELTLAHTQVAGANAAIQEVNNELFVTLAKIIDARDPYVFGHTAKVSEYALALAQEMGMPPERIECVRQAALLHDIGKIGIPEHILNKPTRLTAEEYRRVKVHVTLGMEFLDTCQGLRHLAPIVKYHHERWDGRGYPDGLVGEQTPLEARILALCDAVEAMASDRPYHQALSVPQIIAELRRCSGSQFDPMVVDAFISIAERLRDKLIVNSAREVVLAQEEGKRAVMAGVEWLAQHEAYRGLAAAAAAATGSR